MTSKQHNLKLGLIWLLCPLIVGLSFNLSSYFGFVIWIGLGFIFIGKGIVDGWRTGETQNIDKKNPPN